VTDGRRLGAYVLAADPTWIRSSLSRYYDDLDLLVISASASNRGWTGRPIAADECVALARAVDRRHIARVSDGEWIDRGSPIAADTAQRQAAIAEVGAEVDWILQIDTDEILPDLATLHAVLDEADALGVDAVEWPMRVLYRRLRDGRYLHVVTKSGAPQYEYPGPIAVRAGATVVEARRTAGRFLRPVVRGDATSVQVARPAEPREVRRELLEPADAILHNSWARSPRAVRSKIASWGHNQGLRSQRYYYQTWLPTPLRWRSMRDLHPLLPGVWPRLAIGDDDVEAFLHPSERGGSAPRP
jgi:hypothetical protein